MSTDNKQKRRSNAEINQRRQLGIQILHDYKYNLSIKSFKKIYTKKIQEQFNEDFSSYTLNRDIEAIVGEIRKKRPSFEFSTKPLSKQTERLSITPLANFEKDITEIHLVVDRNSDTIIFDTTNMQLGSDTFVDDAKKCIPKDLPSTALITLRIYFSPMTYRGIETVVCDIYEKSPDYTPFNILSTLARHRCSEIEIKYADIDSLLEFTYKLFNRHWIKQLEKTKKAKKKS